MHTKCYNIKLFITKNNSTIKISRSNFWSSLPTQKIKKNTNLITILYLSIQKLKR